MQTEYSALEISGIITISRRAVSKLATKCGWTYREQPSAAGGKPMRYYYTSGIDPETLKRIAAAETARATADAADTATSRVDETATFPIVASPPPSLQADPQRRALAKADLVAAYRAELAAAGRGHLEAAREEFVTAYNSGASHPLIYSVIGEVSWRTIESWKSRLELSPEDPANHQSSTIQLVDRRGAWRKGKWGLTDAQRDVLIACALHPHALKISEAIRIGRETMRARGIENGLSDRTLRRFITHWRSRNFGKYVFSREGQAAWNDQCSLYIERDPEKIEVGDILVADGHRLNFDIINPFTGKPKRMTLIGWYDMRSNFLAGWDITPNEDTASIAAALRRAILRLGKIPKAAYMDNGKAFGSKVFNGGDLSECGFTGLFGRLGIQTIFAWPYHGQSKTIERFFGTFAELERLAPTYTGTSIEAKPAHMRRGERVHRRQHEAMTGGAVPTLEQSHLAIGSWLDMYHTRSQAGEYCAGRAPMELFEAGRGPGVDPLELTFLMLADSTRTIGRNGISFNGRHYWHAELAERRHPVTIRYDFQDTSAIYVFDENGEYLCEARPLDKLHPAAWHLGTDEDREKLGKYIELKKHIEKRASSFSRQFAQDVVLPEARRQIEAMGFQDEDRRLNNATRLPAPLSDDEKAEKERLDAAVRAAAEADRAAERAENERIEAELERMREGKGEGGRGKWEGGRGKAEEGRGKAEGDIPALSALPEDGPELWRALGRLPEEQRYEKLTELEARDMLIPQQWRAFMRYYEHTEQWERRRSHYDEIRFQARFSGRS
jgi:putative transposase